VSALMCDDAVVGSEWSKSGVWVWSAAERCDFIIVGYSVHWCSGCCCCGLQWCMGEVLIGRWQQADRSTSTYGCWLSQRVFLTAV